MERKKALYQIGNAKIDGRERDLQSSQVNDHGDLDRRGRWLIFVIFVFFKKEKDQTSRRQTTWTCSQPQNFEAPPTMVGRQSPNLLSLFHLFLGCAYTPLLRKLAPPPNHKINQIIKVQTGRQQHLGPKQLKKQKNSCFGLS